MEEFFHRVSQSPRILLKFVLPVLAGLTLFVGMVGSFAEVAPGEVAAIYNLMWGAECTVVQNQGTLTVTPILQRIEKLTIEPQILVLEGKNEGINLTSELDIRAKDGSSFWFDRMEVHYQAMPNAACETIHAFGPGDGYREHGVITDVRNVLRDEFGRYSFEEIADPSKYGAAISASKEELNRRLNPYGLQITQIVQQKPRFQVEVEKAIEDRQTAVQEIEVQNEKRSRLTASKDRKVQDVRQAKNSELQTISANLAGLRKEADNASTATQREADKYYIDTTLSCVGERDANLALASANEDASRKNAEGLKAVINATGAQGMGKLDAIIAEKIMPQIQRISGTPYAQPSTSNRVEVIQTK
jgi:regulator of protease activity HflC (stomatin/prohibitin superfamily)